MRQYSFLNTVLLVNGVDIGGFGELADDVITMERINDSTAHKIGTDGQMTISISADRSGRIAFNLMQSSGANTFLSGLITTQENGFFVPVFVQFKDTRNLDLVSGTQGYIPRPSPIIRGQNANSQAWEIIVERLDMLHGGS